MMMKMKMIPVLRITQAVKIILSLLMTQTMIVLLRMIAHQMKKVTTLLLKMMKMIVKI